MTLLHREIPGLPGPAQNIDPTELDDMSDGDNCYDYLNEYKIMSMLPTLLKNGALLPLVKDLIDFLRTLTRSFFYEFEI